MERAIRKLKRKGGRGGWDTEWSVVMGRARSKKGNREDL